MQCLTFQCADDQCAGKAFTDPGGLSQVEVAAASSSKWLVTVLVPHHRHPKVLDERDRPNHEFVVE